MGYREILGELERIATGRGFQVDLESKMVDVDPGANIDIHSLGPWDIGWLNYTVYKKGPDAWKPCPYVSVSQTAQLGRISQSEADWRTHFQKMQPIADVGYAISCPLLLQQVDGQDKLVSQARIEPSGHIVAASPEFAGMGYEAIFNRMLDGIARQ